MTFYIGSDSGSGQEFNSKEDFLRELALMIDDCEANGGTQFDVTVDADADCFCNPIDPEETTKELVNFAKDLNTKRESCGAGYFGKAEGHIGSGYFCRKKNCFVTGYNCLECEEV